jgi:hypothetical protein
MPPSAWNTFKACSCRSRGISRPVIRQGIAELKNPKTALLGRVRRPGGGRKRIAERDDAVLVDQTSNFTYRRTPKPFEQSGLNSEASQFEPLQKKYQHSSC